MKLINKKCCEEQIFNSTFERVKAIEISIGLHSKLKELRLRLNERNVAKLVDEQVFGFSEKSYGSLNREKYKKLL